MKKSYLVHVDGEVFVSASDEEEAWQKVADELYRMGWDDVEAKEVEREDDE